MANFYSSNRATYETSSKSKKISFKIEQTNDQPTIEEESFSSESSSDIRVRQMNLKSPKKLNGLETRPRLAE